MKKYQILIITLVIIILQCACKNENNYENDTELCELLSKMTDDDQKIRNMDLLQNGTQKQKDSLWKIQKLIDGRNTELLLDITKKRGWVSKNSLNCEKYMAPVVIFRHTPEKYFNEVKEIIDKELQNKRLDGLNYEFINDHLNGRPGFNLEIIEK